MVNYQESAEDYLEAILMLRERLRTGTLDRYRL